MRTVKGSLLFLAFLLLPLLGLQGQQKYALVIGNSAYTNITRLTNPVNDANDMTAVLQNLGFQVDKVLNGSLDQMESAAIRLKNRLSANPGAYGFFFYAGHGVQSNGDNYLIPVDAEIKSETFLRSKALQVQSVLDELNQAGNVLNVVVLDACRDNPFGWKRSGSRGLQTVNTQPADSIIVYATSAGSTAADGDGRNGLFTTHLMNNLKVQGLEVEEIFKRTGSDVIRASGGEQRPAIYSQFYGTAYLGTKPVVTPPNVSSSSQPAPAPPVTTVYKIGDTGPAGGIVFYDKGSYSNGWRYMEAANKDLGTVPWGPDNVMIGGTSTALGAGKENTEKLVLEAKKRGLTGTAAQLCGEYTQNGFAGWFLPSRDELAQLKRNRNVNGLKNTFSQSAGFGSAFYYSSSEVTAGTVWGDDLKPVNPMAATGVSKKGWLVRPVRSF
ncbi:hypothetical protein AGMMS49928_19490 [Spirochaetia bacterium]|nr:hypothetical protein AGMMS49928_19490 [Spirochaetia bacterium]